MLVKFSKIDLIYTVGDPAVVGAMSAIKAAGRDIKLIGFDGNPEAIEAIKSGGMWVADVSQHPEEMGAKSVDVLKDFWAGKSVEKEIKIPTSIIDKDNLPE
jgi:ribose transport system substrate-binding protein